MTYNPEKDMPTSLTEWNELVDYMTAKAKAEYDAAVAQAKAQAEASHATLTGNKPSLADYISQAVASIARPQTRQDFEAMYACYYPAPAPEPEPAPTLEEQKRQKLSELDSAFMQACATATATIDGLVINADETANRNVGGLIVKLEAEESSGPVDFCLADNSFASVSLEQLRAFRLAIIEKGQGLYAQKWTLREQINAAQDCAALLQISISFA